ncbi:MAG: 6-carboxytetrahydropterin synthase [Nitrososphaerota archaeon]|nr:6-carboxytetrahydropterin synthase [Nitrososphaerota archaeon]
MQKNLLDGVSARLKELGKGGYARVYRRDGRTYPSGLNALVGAVLDAAGVDFKTDATVMAGSSLRADFVVGDRLIFIGMEPSLQEKKRLSMEGKRSLVLSESSERSDVFDLGVRASRDGESSGRRQTIFLDDPSFNFDYAHILPKTEKCSVMHGHTSSALVELIGAPRDGMVVDFNDAKPVIKDAIAALDHKLFISERYVTRRDRRSVSLSFETVHGPFELSVPRGTTVLLEGEATVENLAQELLRRIVPKMPSNVEAVGVYVYEGLNKGTHLLAQIHSKEAERRRMR